MRDAEQPLSRSLTVEEYAQQECRSGRRLHQSEGVWWETPFPGFSRPLIRESVFRAGEVFPRRRGRLIGYAHCIDIGSYCERTYNPMVREWREPTEFTLMSLRKSRRSDVRRAVKKCDVGRVDNIGPYLDDALGIVCSARRRTGVGRPVTYYQRNGDRWKRGLANLATQPGRYLFGAFVDEKLISYIFFSAIEETVYIEAAKSHSDFLKYNPNDALVFEVLSCAYNVIGANKVIFGSYVSDDMKLNYFKESYGFEKRMIPEMLMLQPGFRGLHAKRRSFGRLRKWFG